MKKMSFIAYALSLSLVFVPALSFGQDATETPSPAAQTDNSTQKTTKKKHKAKHHKKHVKKTTSEGTNTAGSETAPATK